jgi:hypothetical protein
MERSVVYCRRTYCGYDLRWQAVPLQDVASIAPRMTVWLKSRDFAHVNELLLAIGGALVVPPMELPPCRFEEREMKKVASRGHFFPGTPVCMKPGEPSHCHRNVAWLYHEGTPISIATGYALSRDGRWREHTWGVATRTMPCSEFDEVNAGDVVETTEGRICYYGFVLSKSQAATFVEANG